ncbi:hypothetical protein BDR03DRAFT_985296 [Suillus americanus]|nr:hypothetical protein BDR03DRAFT_985296 [Suillus americanus]
MSVFEPRSVIILLKNSTVIPPPEKNVFKKHWAAGVEKCVAAWKYSRSHKSNPRPEFQLKWEAEVIDCRHPGGGPVESTAQYLKPLNIIHLFYFPQLAQCPYCGSHDSVVWEGWMSTGARELHGLCYEEMALGTQLWCNICKEKSAKEPPTTRNSQGLGKSPEIEGYCFATTSAVYWKSWEHWKFLVASRSSSIATTINNISRTGRMSQMQPKANNIVNYFTGGKSCSSQTQVLQEFLDPGNSLGYADKWISDKVITEVFVDFTVRTRQKETICGSLDNTFKAASKAMLTNKDRQKSRELKGGILSVLNEDNQIMSWTCTNAEITKLLQGLKRRHELLDVPQPKMMVADNCCQVQKAVSAAMPETDSKLDVWHFGARIDRYIAAMLHSNKSPYRAAVAADIIGAILEKHAECGGPAEYWDQEEQEWRLIVAFDKWADKAAQKVHQEQLKHVHNGCLKRNIKGIRANGSQIDGFHKGWNSLQHAQPSGIIMLSALGHDFVLRCEEVDLALWASCNIFVNEWQIDPALLELPAGASKSSSSRVEVMPPSPMKQKVILDSDDDQGDGNSTAKKLWLICQDNVLQPAFLSNVPGTVSSAGKLDGYFSSVRAARYGEECKSNTRHHGTSIGDTAALPINISISDFDLPPSTSAGINNSDIPPSTSSISANINNSVILSAGQTPSQRLFSIATGIDPRSLAMQDSDEFYLFMDM